MKELQEMLQREILHVTTRKGKLTSFMSNSLALSESQKKIALNCQDKEREYFDWSIPIGLCGDHTYPTETKHVLTGGFLTIHTFYISVSFYMLRGCGCYILPSPKKVNFE